MQWLACWQVVIRGVWCRDYSICTIASMLSTLVLGGGGQVVPDNSGIGGHG